jgi:hypothetical protein
MFIGIQYSVFLYSSISAWLILASLNVSIARCDATSRKSGVKPKSSTSACPSIFSQRKSGKEILV